jgi:hypothetical protein
MKTTQANGARIAREVEREREQRLKNDDLRAGIGSDDHLRAKDARENSGSSDLQRPPAR